MLWHFSSCNSETSLHPYLIKVLNTNGAPAVSKGGCKHCCPRRFRGQIDLFQILARAPTSCGWLALPPLPTCEMGMVIILRYLAQCHYTQHTECSMHISQQYYYCQPWGEMRCMECGSGLKETLSIVAYKTNNVCSNTQSQQPFLARQLGRMEGAWDLKPASALNNVCDFWQRYRTSCGFSLPSLSSGDNETCLRVDIKMK